MTRDPHQAKQGARRLPELGLHQSQPGLAAVVQAQEVARHRHTPGENRKLLHGGDLLRRHHRLDQTLAEPSVVAAGIGGRDRVL